MVRFRPPKEAPYWGLHLDNYWYKPLSWGDRRSQLNDRGVALDANGMATVVISTTRPEGAGNWLETQGHRQGSIVFRWSRSDEPCPVFECQVAPVARWQDVSPSE